MPLVHVEGADPVGDAQRFEHRETAITENRLLAQAVAAVAAVETRGQRAIARIVALEIGIEQINGHGRGGGSRADHVVTPSPDLHRAALDCDRDRPIDAEHARPRVPNLPRFGLIPAGIEVLHEVAEVIKQRYPDDRQTEVGRRQQHVTCQYPEAAAVRRQRRIAGDLHREIGDTRRLTARDAEGVQPAFEGGALVGTGPRSHGTYLGVCRQTTRRRAAVRPGLGRSVRLPCCNRGQCRVLLMCWPVGQPQGTAI